MRNDARGKVRAVRNLQPLVARPATPTWPHPLRTTDIFSEYLIPIASDAHHAVLDLIAACRGPRDEQLLALRLNGETQEAIAYEVGIWQSSVARRLDSLMERAHLDELGKRLRTKRIDSAETTPTRTGLRFPKHTRAHKNCWCERKAAGQ